MMIKLFFRDADFDLALKKQKWFCLGLEGLGLLGLCVSRYSQAYGLLPDFIQGFYAGASAGLIIAGFALLFHLRQLKINPKAYQKAKILHGDERERAIDEKAVQCSGWILFFTITAGIFLSLPFNRTVFFTLMAVFLLYALATGLARLWYRWKL